MIMCAKNICLKCCYRLQGRGATITFRTLKVQSNVKVPFKTRAKRATNLKACNLHLNLQLFTSLHTVRFNSKYDHFCPAFRDKIDESFLKFFNQTLVLLNLNSTVRSLVWENEWNNWEMFTSSLRSHNFKSGNITDKIRHCSCKVDITSKIKGFGEESRHQYDEKVVIKTVLARGRRPMTTTMWRSKAAQTSEEMSALP